MITKKIHELARKGRPKNNKAASGSASKSNLLHISKISRDLDFGEAAKVGSYVIVCVLNPEVRLAPDCLNNLDTIPGDTVAATAWSEERKFVGMIFQWVSPLDAENSIASGILHPAVSSISRSFESLMTGIQVADFPDVKSREAA